MYRAIIDRVSELSHAQRSANGTNAIARLAAYVHVTCESSRRCGVFAVGARSSGCHGARSPSLGRTSRGTSRSGGQEDPASPTVTPALRQGHPRTWSRHGKRGHRERSPPSNRPEGCAIAARVCCRVSPSRCLPFATQSLAMDCADTRVLRERMSHLRTLGRRCC